MRRIKGRGLSSGTSPERIAPESLTRANSGFVHRNISRWYLIAALDQVCRGATSGGLAAKSLKFTSARSRIRSEEESTEFGGSVIPGCCQRVRSLTGPALDLRCAIRTSGIDDIALHCVLATRGGDAWVMNWVASSMAVPSGVGITIRNGTRIRVPAIGANVISMLRWAARYLITGRSGM